MVYVGLSHGQNSKENTDITEIWESFVGSLIFFEKN